MKPFKIDDDLKFATNWYVTKDLSRPSSAGCCSSWYQQPLWQWVEHRCSGNTHPACGHHNPAGGTVENAQVWSQNLQNSVFYCLKRIETSLQHLLQSPLFYWNGHWVNVRLKCQWYEGRTSPWPPPPPRIWINEIFRVWFSFLVALRAPWLS